MIFGGLVRKMYKGNTVMKWWFREHPHFLGWVSFNANIKLKWPKGTMQYRIKTLGILEMFASIPAIHPIDMVLKRLILYVWMTMYSYVCIYIYICANILIYAYNNPTYYRYMTIHFKYKKTPRIPDWEPQTSAPKAPKGAPCCRILCHILWSEIHTFQIPVP